MSLSALSSQMENWYDFETTWVFSLAQLLLRQTDTHDSNLSNDVKISVVACIKAPLGKRGNSTLLSAQPVCKNITQSELFFAYKNVTQSALFFSYNNPPPLRQL